MRTWRRCSALYLLTLFLGAAAAPHHHLDPVADLVSDRPSNSGTFAQIQGPGSIDTGFYPGALVQDVSCLACFHSDFGGSPAVALTFTPALEALARQPLMEAPSVPSSFAADTSSRAPPVLS